MSLKVMVVDDEATSLRLIHSLASELGHAVFECESYEVAGQRAESQRFDVVLAGMKMPESEGLALARRIRDSQVNRECTIVMLSAGDDAKTLRKAFSEGADFVLTKPLVAGRVRPLLAAMASPGWKGKRHGARMPLFTAVKCVWDEREFAVRSLNISESGMLLQPCVDIEVGQEVALEFTIGEVGASLNVLARIVRKEQGRSIGVEFMGLAPEEQNAIQLYVLGHLKEPSLARDLPEARMRGKLFDL